MRERKKIVTSDLELRMPKEILKFTFTFFNQKNLEICSLVNINFNELSREAINKLKIERAKNIYYTLGNPIITAKAGNTRNSWKPMNVPPAKIQASFDVKNIQMLALFKTELEAIQCPQSLFVPMGNIGVKPAVFEVLYIGESSTPITETERINVIPLKAILRRDASEKKPQTIYYSNKPGDLTISAEPEMNCIIS